MYRKTAWLVPLIAMLAGGAPPIEKASDMVVHEWGTFLAMSGSDGVSLDGMYHEEHALPGFVHARGRDQLRPRSIFLKGETPVIYFYTATEQRVRVEVKFPRGLWTQWYPQAAAVGPDFSTRPTAETLRDGRIVWNAAVVPAASKPIVPPPPPTRSDALWNFARDVDAAFVRTDGPKGQETERYLFYRGLGTATLPVRMAADSGGTLLADREARTDVRHVFVLRVEDGKGAYAYRPALAAGEEATQVIPSMDRAIPLDRFADAIADDLAGRLVESGLYAKEARAMVNTWKPSYFRTAGVRALFVLPQRWTDDFIPIAIKPSPKEVVRVMVGRLELLTPAREALAERSVRDLASTDEARRRESFAYLRAQGRYVEPIVRRVLESTGDEAVKRLCTRLLLAGFVTDLRAAVHEGPGSKPLPPEMVWNEDPAFVRAQLASLLREVGLDAEARAEGAAAVKELKAKSPAVVVSCDSRQGLRAWGRALEGMGDDRGAADRYGRLVGLGGVAARTADCRGCHRQVGQGDDAWYRDWWAGERYAAALSRSGGLDARIAEMEKAAANPASREETLLRLAYLYAARGRGAKAEAIWTDLESRASKTKVASAAPGAKPALGR